MQHKHADIQGGGKQGEAAEEELVLRSLLYPGLVSLGLEAIDQAPNAHGQCDQKSDPVGDASDPALRRPVNQAAVTR
jgi:hypothetical protein